MEMALGHPAANGVYSMRDKSILLGQPILCHASSNPIRLAFAAARRYQPSRLAAAPWGRGT